jgi:predicted RNase H-like HicB family nuclease
MSLDKAELKSALQAVFEDLADGKTAEDAATQLADAIDVYVKTAMATVQVPPGTFLVAAMAGVPNPAPIPLTGGPTTTPPGGLT